MSSLRTLVGVALTLPLVAGTAAAQTADPGLELRAEWVTTECVTPAIFRVTMRNGGDATFWVPKPRHFGNAEAINLLAKQEGVISSTSMYYPTPQPQGYWADQDNFVELEPGEEFTTELNFDGAFTFHGPSPTEPTEFKGEVRFLYTQSEPYAGLDRGDFGPLLFYSQDWTAISDILSCLE